MTDDGQLAENGAGALLVANGVTRHFPGIVALAGVDFDVAPGEVHALVGENGAGKSTLIKVLTGVYPPDGGSLWWQGRRVVLSDPQAAYRLGIAVIHQERQLVPDFTALENLYLGRRYPRRLGGLAVDWPAMRRRASAVMATLGVEVPLDVPVARLPPAARTVVELLRANLWECRLRFLDEPTAARTDPLRPDPPVAGAGYGLCLCFAPPGGDLRAGRSDHGTAQRPAGRHPAGCGS